MLVPGLVQAALTVRESGSTLLFPVVTAWAQAYAKIVPDLEVTTDATGSGAGVEAVAAGTAELGASDVALGASERERGDLTEIPLAISGQFIGYNLPGVPSLHLSADVLAAIYEGTLTRWNDPRIAALNPGAALPNATIVPLRRSDRSGDTFLFAAYLTAGAPHRWTLPPATALAWPSVALEQTAKGNRELLDLLTQTRNGIAYLGISFYAQATSSAIGIAALRNRAGDFVMPDGGAIEAAARQIAQHPADPEPSLIDLPGAGTYPIVNVEYAVVRKTQAQAGTAAALRAFLTWIVDPAGGSAPAMLEPVHFTALPDALRVRSRAAIAALR
ncbi:MAG: phosphate ABC transporter substrate-binding protein PstS [Vulcanimicrobiaceae bacterium]|jgi:phosphate transport system substrate-binding protein